ncbi:MAG: tRNA (guanosine(18)-2'-O)-methyltransferase TrmH [Gammaproteobacteria bacterium]|nr:tRNA (guanosine(18)-2'-O)-methyltransferase TrmH [Gammaproteobacteria bacterium]
MPTERFNKIKQVLLHRQPDLTVLVEAVDKPHNLSAIARTCDAVGIAELHAVSDISGLKLSQKAAGGIRKWLKLTKHKTTVLAFEQLKATGMQLVVTHLSEATKDYKEIDYTRPTAIIAGSESEGVSDYAIEHADHCIAIPMLGMAQSLNVSVAVSVILYEALQQRQQADMYATLRLDPHSYKTKLFEGMHPKVTQYCRQRQQPYPQMDDDGNIIGDVFNLNNQR